MAEVLSVKGLHVLYGASHALQGVDISLHSGIHAVLGRNGMGKTTLCNAIMGLTPSSKGSIRFEEKEITGMSPHKIAKLGIGFTPQGRRLWPSLSVEEHLRLCSVKGSPWTVERIYETFPRLAERKSNGGSQLSGGEQQMLAIARALLPAPQLLVLDEPTEGLAPVIVDRVVAVLQKLKQEDDVSILLVEQNIAVATAAAEDISVMLNGRISTVIDAADLAADKALQQQLLGVGRYDSEHTPASGGRSNVAESRKGIKTTLHEIVEESQPPMHNYTPPPHWSADVWKEETMSTQTLQSPQMMGHVIVAGTFDTKSRELNFIRDRLLSQRLSVRTVDLSTSGQASSADIPPHLVAAFHPSGPAAVMTGDRGSAVAGMSMAFEAWMRAAEGVAGIISAAGSGGTALATPAMRALPVGVPKMMISTVASGDVSEYVGPSDMMMMYSVTDVQGINRISAQVLANGADALAGAVRFGRANPPSLPDMKPAIGLTMFGVTTPAVQALTEQLQERFECLVFHATGVGGQSMEKLADNGLITAALDLTTTEVCDMMMGGVFAAKEDRFGAFIRTQIPYVGSVGALDMVNWGGPNTVPAEFAERLFYEHNPQVTLMRTTAEENSRIGTWIADRLNKMNGPVRFLLPLQGVSALDASGQPFHDPVADAALFHAIRSSFTPSSNRKLVEIDCHINDPAFTEAAMRAFNEIAGMKGE